MSRNLVAISLLLVLLHPTASFADPPALEVNPDNTVSVGSELTVPKANITSVLHLAPLSSPPANPSAGDIYFTTTDELLIYANGKWKPIVAASASHGAKHITSGSGTWSVPAGIYSLTVTVAGGGGGGGSRTVRRQGKDWSCSPAGKSGGNGGVHFNVIMDVTPGQQFSYSIGSGGAAGRSGGTTVFGNLSASGGQGGSPYASGSGGSPAGTYPYGSNGQGGAGATVCSKEGGSIGASGASGAIYIQY